MAFFVQACKNFINAGQCVAFCPLEFIYDPRTYRKVPNVNAKYSYGSLCVEKCPGAFLSVCTILLLGTFIATLVIHKLCLHK